LDTVATVLPVYPGDAAVFTITIYNQGTLPASNVQVTDYIPAGLILDDADWILNGDTATTIVA